MSPAGRILLLTGASGVGKTTVLCEVARGLAGRRVRGFWSEEMRSAGRREGFRLETFDGQRAVLARRGFASRARVGPYGVDLGELDRIATAALAPGAPADVYLVDEIGKMECFSPRFIQLMGDLLDSGSPVVATIHRSAGGFVEEVKRRDDVKLVEITRENRAAIPQRVLRWLDQLSVVAPGAVQEQDT